MKTQTHSGSHPVNRRQFFRRLAVLGSSAAAATGAFARSSSPPPAATATPQSSGYRLTDHIRKYYRKAGASSADPI